MSLKCEKCGDATAERQDRFCPRHAMKVLKEQDDLGYLEPLSYRTMDGVVTLSHQQFLTLAETPATTEASDLNCSDC